MLPQHTFPGNVILSSRASSGLSPPVQHDPELEKLCVGHITAAAKNVFSALEGLSEKKAAIRSGEDDNNLVGEFFRACMTKICHLGRSSGESETSKMGT